VQVALQGSAKMMRDNQRSQPLLLLAGILALYLILGVLYESLLHPLTIISTLPSAGLGALLTLTITHTEFTIIALIGVFLLMGLVIKNAILMVDVAIVQQRMGRTAAQAIFIACQQRFRPIMMTSLAAMMGAVPLVFASGEGSELRTPLGLSIVGGLLVSQLLTLYTTPAVYLGLESRWLRKFWG
jgi:multidrug efflux pump